MCAGLFHAPSGCRVAGTHIFHDTASGLDLEDFSGCMGSFAEVPHVHEMLRFYISRVLVCLLLLWESDKRFMN